MHALAETVGAALGFGLNYGLSVLAMGLRALVLYVVGLGLIRVFRTGPLFGRCSPYDLVLGIIFGTTLSRAINGGAPFFATIFASVILVLLHWLSRFAASRSDVFGFLFKGRPATLISDGEVRWRALRREHVSESDLLEALRLRGAPVDPGRIKAAHLERSGDISVTPAADAPRVIEVAVEHGVQTVRIELR